jgi:hypothetical protein
MNSSIKPLGFALATLLSTSSLANTVYFQFRHVMQPTSAPTFLCFLVRNSWHSAGMDCSTYPGSILYDGHQAERLAQGGFLQDHVNTGLGMLYGNYSLDLVCINSRGQEQRERKTFELKKDGIREIDISASCTLDAHGNPQKPSNIHIEPQKPQ